MFSLSASQDGKDLVFLLGNAMQGPLRMRRALLSVRLEGPHACLAALVVYQHVIELVDAYIADRFLRETAVRITVQGSNDFPQST